MPRKPKNETPRDLDKIDDTIVIERTLWWKQIKDIIASPRTKLICGVLLVALALFVFISYVSFFFTGHHDQSILLLDQAERISQRASIQNVLGLPGAKLSAWLIDGTFGVMSVLFALMALLYGLRLIKPINLSPLRLLLCSTFSIVWGSVALGFVQLMFTFDLFFRLGGKHGEWLADWLNSYIQPLGMLMLLVLSMVIFLIIADKKFVDRVKAAWQWLTSRFHKQNSIEDDMEPETAAEPEDKGEDNILVLDTSNNGVTVTIQQNDTEEQIDELQPIPIEEPEDDIVLEDEEDDNKHKEEAGQDTNLDIVDTPEVEISEDDPEYILKTQGPYDPRKDLEFYKFPSLQLLKVYDNETKPIINIEEQQANSNRIIQTLKNYDVEIVDIHAIVGPTVTLYEIVPKAGTRIAKIQNLENDIMLSLSAIGIRIIAPIPGKGSVGIEVPNVNPQIVSMHSVIASKRFQEETKMRLPVAIGRTITNEVFCFDLAKTPHLLVAGATGQGKSVGLNAIITSLLYKKHPAELKFVLVDPKMVEFSIYKPLLKHYMAAMPDQEDRDIIITDCQKVINTLNSLVIEMEDRYSLLAEANCRNLEDYNDKFTKRQLNPLKDVENVVTKKILHHHYMPYLVIVIDEYGDFIMQAGKEVERPIQRIAQKARAVGMHMILATQRPDVKIVTGTIKANIPTRIAFRTQSVVDSRTVLDTKGADQLIGKGDMLYSGGGNITRIQCAFVDTPEVEAIVESIHAQQGYTQPYQLPEYVPEGQDEPAAPGEVDMKRLDPMFADVARYVVSKQEGSTSRLQRAFEIGYNRAGKLSDQLERAGIVGPNKGPKGRDVLIQDLESLERILETLGLS